MIKTHGNLKDGQKAFDKIQHPFMIRTLSKVDVEEMHLNIIKATYDKPIANIILINERTRTFPLR